MTKIILISNVVAAALTAIAVTSCSSGLQTFSENKSTSSSSGAANNTPVANLKTPSLSSSKTDVTAFSQVEFSADSGETIQNPTRVEFDVDGDGTADSSWTAGGESSSPTANIIFYEPGTFTAKVKVFDSQGNTSEGTTELEIKEPTLQEFLESLRGRIVMEGRLRLNDLVELNADTSLLVWLASASPLPAQLQQISRLNIVLRQINLVIHAISINRRDDLFIGVADLLALLARLRQTGALSPLDSQQVSTLVAEHAPFHKPVRRGPYGWFTGGLNLLQLHLIREAQSIAESHEWEPCPPVGDKSNLGLSRGQYCKAIRALEAVSFSEMGADTAKVETALLVGDALPMQDRLATLTTAARALSVANSDLESLIEVLNVGQWVGNATAAQRYNQISPHFVAYKSALKSLTQQATTYIEAKSTHSDLLAVQMQNLQTLETESSKLWCPLGIAKSLNRLRSLALPGYPSLDFKFKALYQFMMELARTQTASGQQGRFSPLGPLTPAGRNLSANSATRDRYLGAGDLENWRSLLSTAQGTPEDTLETSLSVATVGFVCPSNDGI